MEWKFVTKSIKEIKPQRRNPRKISHSQQTALSTSLKKFGCSQPIVIADDGTLIGGHQRFELMKKEGKTSFDCMECQDPLSEKEIDELTIRLNKNVGDFDFDLLANSYEPSDLVQWGFSMEELHLESIPDQTEKPKLCQLTAKFENEDDLRQAETHIAAIIDLYSSASYKVKVK